MKKIIKRYLLGLFAGVLSSAVLSTSAFAHNHGSKKIIVSDVGFSTPESVEYYAAADQYLVNNINGSPFEADDNGFISKLNPDGSVDKLKWIDGGSDQVELDAPKGMAIVGNKLFVADITYIRVFELPSGKQLPSIKVEGSSFLNGVSAGDGDYVYVTDMGVSPGFKSSGTDAVYKIWANGKIETLLKDPDMGRPNGVLNMEGEVYVVFFSFAKMIKISPYNGQFVEMEKPNAARLDGLVGLSDGSIVMSSWKTSSIDVYKNGQYSTIAKDLTSPADIDVDTKRNKLLVPLFKENKVVILPL